MEVERYTEEKRHDKQKRVLVSNSKNNEIIEQKQYRELQQNFNFKQI
jgi:hypothetical protein